MFGRSIDCLPLDKEAPSSEILISVSGLSTLNVHRAPYKKNGSTCDTHHGFSDLSDNKRGPKKNNKPSY